MIRLCPRLQVDVKLAMWVASKFAIEQLGVALQQFKQLRTLSVELVSNGLVPHQLR